MSVIAVGYRAPQETATSAVASVADTAKASSDHPAVDAVVATRIASVVAKNTNMPISGNVRELADSTQLMAQYSNTSTDSSTVSKPTIVAISSASRNIITYTAVEGDTVASVAAKYGLSEDTVKWANNLSSNTIAVGSTLEILPRNGLAYVVKAGDTLDSIASKYKADPALIISSNDLEVSSLSTGLKIIIPEGVLPTTERPGYVAQSVGRAVRNSNGFITGVGTWSGEVLSMNRFYGVNANDGGYAAGNCTAWAFYRRAQMGNPVPSNLGNANTWATKAKSQGYLVNSTPSVGAVIQAGMHVGVVEEIYPNGDLRISDMNYGYRVYNLASRVIPASTIKNYAFIH